MYFKFDNLCLLYCGLDLQIFPFMKKGIYEKTCNNIEEKYVFEVMELKNVQTINVINSKEEKYGSH